jgi:signal peptidase I
MQKDNGTTPETSEAEETAQTENDQTEEKAENDQAANKAMAEEVVVDAGTATAAPKEKKKKNVKKEIISWIITLAVLIALFIRSFIFEPIYVDGHSMCDTLQDREVMFVTKYDYIIGEPQRGDVVICKYPDRTENFVKRLMAVPGDTIEIKNNVVYINGEALDEPYLTPSRNDNGFSMDPITMGEDDYFVMGDNRDNSHDCRNMTNGQPATLTRSQIVGHVRCVIYPFANIRGIE